ncbi:MAG: arsenate reductase (glutaredoxin) [Pigmentiphaga sp.]
MTPTIYHNPRCGTSRTTLALLQEKGIAPTVIEYLKTPPDRATLNKLAQDCDEGAQGLLRKKEALVAELGLDQPGVTDPQILDAIAAHPILLNRPVVVTSKGTRVCRPAERVLDLID